VVLHDTTRLQSGLAQRKPVNRVLFTIGAPRWHWRHAHCCMSIARQRAAARKGLTLIVAALTIAPPAVWAESGPQLILPLVTALAVASAAAKAPQQVAVMQPGRRPVLSLIPSQVKIEDGYEIDVEDYIGRRRPNAVADSDRIVSYDVLRRRRKGWMTSLVYDTEHRGPLHSTDDVLRFVVDYRF
jgi:hypothetical protein